MVLGLVSCRTGILRSLLGTFKNGCCLSEVLGLAELKEVILVVELGPLLRPDILIHGWQVLLPPCLLHHERFLLLLKLNVDATKFVQALYEWHDLLLERILVIALHEFFN